MKKLRVPLIALGFTAITVAILAQTFPTTETFRITDSFSEVKRKLNQSGVTVAALSSVGTNLAVTLPVAKGGTGATNAAGARSSLGIPESTTNAVQTLATGGTGSNLTDPAADRILFWDDSAGSNTWLAAGTGLAITATTIDVSTVPLANGGTGATNATGARTALELPEGLTNAAMPLLATTTAAEGRAALELPEGLTNSAMPLLSSTTPAEARAALELPEGVTNTVPIYTTQTAAEMRALMELPEGLTNAFPATLTDAAAARAAMELPEGLTNAFPATLTSAGAARTAIGLGEYLTNAVTALPSVLGIEAGTVTTTADGTVTNTFAAVFASPPIVVIAPIGEAIGVTNNISVTESNFVYTAGQDAQVANFIVFGTR